MLTHNSLALLSPEQGLRQWIKKAIPVPACPLSPRAGAAISSTTSLMVQLNLPIACLPSTSFSAAGSLLNPRTTHLVLHVLQAWRQVLQLGQLLDLGCHGLPRLPQPGLGSLSSLLQNLLLAFQDAGLHSRARGLVEGGLGCVARLQPRSGSHSSLLQEDLPAVYVLLCTEAISAVFGESWGMPVSNKAK